MEKEQKITKRKTYGLNLDRKLMSSIQHLGVDEDKYANELLEEAIRDLLKKYRDKAKR